MARALRFSTRQPAYGYGEVPAAVAVTPVPTFLLRGMNITLPKTRLPEGVSVLVQNLWIKDGAYQARDATSVVGTAAAADLVYAGEAILSDDSSFPLRFSTAGVEVYSVGAWTATTGTAWSTTDLRPFSITGWKDEVVFAESTLGIYKLAFTAGFPKTLLTALANVQHLTTFNGRVVASLPTRIQWSAKNSNSDWVGIGSGYEDLLSSPGGRTDAQTAVVPVSDDTAIVVRSQSFWQMQTTGSFDAPFSFTQLYAGQGSRYPRTCVGVPRGAMCLGDAGSVWLVTLDGGLKDVGKPIASALNAAPGELRLTTATYDPKNNEYRLCVPSAAAAATVWRYNIDNDAWTQDTYSFPIRSISYALFAQGIAIDELTGTIDGLAGAIDDLITGVRKAQIFFAMKSPYRSVVQENARYNTDLLRDVDYTGGTKVITPAVIKTAPVRRGNLLVRAEVTQLVADYESSADVDGTFYVSSDAATWELLGLKVFAQNQDVAPVSLAPVSWDATFDRDILFLQLSFANMRSTRLIDLFAFVREGGYRTDAS